MIRKIQFHFKSTPNLLKYKSKNRKNEQESSLSHPATSAPLLNPLPQKRGWCIQNNPDLDGAVWLGGMWWLFGVLGGGGGPCSSSFGWWRGRWIVGVQKMKWLNICLYINIQSSPVKCKSSIYHLFVFAKPSMVCFYCKFIACEFFQDTTFLVQCIATPTDFVVDYTAFFIMIDHFSPLSKLCFVWHAYLT